MMVVVLHRGVLNASICTHEQAVTESAPQSSTMAKPGIEKVTKHNSDGHRKGVIMGEIVSVRLNYLVGKLTHLIRLLDLGVHMTALTGYNP